MVILVLAGVSALAGLLLALAIRRWPTADPAASMSRSFGQELSTHRRLRSFVHDRLDPARATGFALTLACACIIVGGVVLGVLAFLVRRNAGTSDVDTSVARWAATHSGATTTTVLRAVTQLGATPTVIAVSLAVGAVEYRRIKSRSLWLFLVLVVGGQLLIVNLIKLGVARARPTLDPLASFSGSSFPSGHTASAAACYAALALVMSRGRSPRVRAALAGGAGAMAVAVGCSRMLLGVHWFTDVVAGLAVGWAWFSGCAIATGGRLLRFGAPTEVAVEGPAVAPARSAARTGEG